MSVNIFPPALAFALSLAILSPTGASASVITWNVSLDTSGLGQAGPSEAIFVLTDGSGIGDGNNTATLSQFAFDGGSTGPVDTVLTGGDVDYALNLSDGAILTDGQPVNVFAGFFTAGTNLTFELDLRTNVDAGPTPDQFSFAVLDPNGNPIPTSDPSGFDNLAVINIDSANPTPLTYTNLVTLTPQSEAAPEPASGLVTCVGLAALALWRDRRVFHRVTAGPTFR